MKNPLCVNYGHQAVNRSQILHGKCAYTSVYDCTSMLALMHNQEKICGPDSFIAGSLMRMIVGFVRVFVLGASDSVFHVVINFCV